MGSESGVRRSRGGDQGSRLKGPRKARIRTRASANRRSLFSRSRRLRSTARPASDHQDQLRLGTKKACSCGAASHPHPSSARPAPRGPSADHPLGLQAVASCPSWGRAPKTRPVACGHVTAHLSLKRPGLGSYPLHRRGAHAEHPRQQHSPGHEPLSEAPPTAVSRRPRGGRWHQSSQRSWSRSLLTVQPSRGTALVHRVGGSWPRGGGGGCRALARVSGWVGGGLSRAEPVG